MIFIENWAFAFYNVLTLQTLAINLVPVTFSYYMLLLAHVDVNRHKLLHIFFRLCIAVNVIIALANPKLHWAFSFEHYIDHSCTIPQAILMVIG